MRGEGVAGVKAFAPASETGYIRRLSAKRRTTPPAVGFPQKKIFEDELRFARLKRSSARWARYPGIDAVRQRLSSNHLIERPAMRADEIDLCGLDQRVFGCRNGHRTAVMTLT